MNLIDTDRILAMRHGNTIPHYGANPIIDEFIKLILDLQPTVEAIPIEWIKKYVEENTQLMINPKYENTEFTEEPVDYYIKLFPYQINIMLKVWEKTVLSKKKPISE